MVTYQSKLCLYVCQYFIDRLIKSTSVVCVLLSVFVIEAPPPTGVDTPSDKSWRKNFNTFSDTAFQGTENCHSFPFLNPTQDRSHFKRSSSINGAPNTNHSDSKNPMPRKLVPSTHRLYHSYSAPIVGDTQRRMSLQMSLGEGGVSEWEGRPPLRRTSSMVYVDKGKSHIRIHV